MGIRPSWFLISAPAASEPIRRAVPMKLSETLL
jgi:hypothetical protein